MEIAGYKVNKTLSAFEDKSLYLIEDGGGKLYVLKVFTKIYKFPIYQSLAKLKHKNIPRIAEAVSFEDSFYIIEEYIDGKTLKEILTDTGALIKAEALDTMYQLCDVLAYLHSQPVPIIHRDITPANIMLTVDGVVKLLDFDIAREYKKDEERDTEIIGTKPYAPPEQYGFAQSDHRADIYALGVLLTVMLTNTYFPRRITDAHLKRVARRCTAIDANKRYKNVKQLKRRLSPSFVKRYIATGAAAACIALAILFGLIIRDGVNDGDIGGEGMLSGAAYMVGSLSEAEPVTLHPGGYTSLSLTLHNHLDEQLCPDEETIIWTMENGYVEGDRLGIGGREPGLLLFNNGFYVGHDTTERLVTVRAASESNPSVYHIFFIYVSTEAPRTFLGTSVFFTRGEPGRITYSFHVENIPDGVYHGSLHMHYPDISWVSVVYPETIRYTGCTLLFWFEGNIIVENGKGEIPFYYDGSLEATHIINFTFGLNVPSHGLNLDFGTIFIR
ncbi:MAG: serine/threonine protein kinase [Defluviitaleaceae bacterium]|nr:serine/threonine protein kinase [Defluviitaleaceae bacterium]